MLAAPIPGDEPARLASLRALHVLDTPSEERFDRVARLAARLFRVPIAYVSLIDADRQWYKAKHGLAGDGTPRDISFCGHAILGKDALVVPDTLLDDRFRDNPLVTDEPFLRFYAGHPLVGPGGHNVGTLCVADRAPRAFSDGDRRALREFAKLVERELNLEDVIRLQAQLIRAREDLARELADAARYVRSLLPPPLRGPDVSADWCYQPSSTLGGDAFGYHRLDDGRLAAYLLDVSGHGVGAALLSVSALQALRGGSLPGVDFADPAAVLAGLNRAFPMERHGEKYFTAWYGVYDRGDRRLTYASAGHPPAVLIGEPRDDAAIRLDSTGFVIGMLDETAYEARTLDVPGGARLFLFSDGAYEIVRPDGSHAGLEDWVAYLERTIAARGECPDSGSPFPDAAYRDVLALRGAPSLDDDFALVEFRLGRDGG